MAERTKGWGAAKNVKKVQQRDTWGAQTKRKDPKGRADIRDGDKGAIWEGSRKIRWFDR